VLPAETVDAKKVRFAEREALALLRDVDEIWAAKGKKVVHLDLARDNPSRAVYLTDGPSRIVKVGSVTVQFTKRSPRQVRSTSPMSSLVFAALRSLGKANVTRTRVAHLRTTLSPADRRRLLRDLPLAPAWMHPHLRFIAGDET
jgi:hypothetical protein